MAHFFVLLFREFIDLFFKDTISELFLWSVLYNIDFDITNFIIIECLLKITVSYDHK